MKMLLHLLFILAVFLGKAVSVFYLPGVAPKDYKQDDPIELRVNKLTSVHTQLPFPYYSHPFCKPENIKDISENIGMILRGDRIQNSLYKLEMKKDVTCRALCEPPVRAYTPSEIELLKKRVSDDYRVHWIVDNLPNAQNKTYIENSKKVIVYEDGFPLGFNGEDRNRLWGGTSFDKGALYLNNHVDITIWIHPNLVEVGTEPTWRIVAFETEPVSIKHDTKVEGGNSWVPKTCLDYKERKAIEPLELKSDLKEIVWTYSISFQESATEWSSRWDVYLMMLDTQIHWFSIVNSLMIVLFLTGMVAMIMLRTVYADLRRYREMEDLQEEAQEETGWKLVHADVFRPPNKAMLLSVFVGTGVQIFSMTAITILFALLGFLSPANRGSLLTAMIVLYVVMGALAGYFSARLYKMFKGTQWKKNTLATAFLLPGIVFILFFVLNIVIHTTRSTAATPFLTLLALAGLWFGVSVPLVFFGSYFGYKKPAIEHPVRTNQIPRQIPDQVWYMQPIFSILMGGILPFGAVFIELYFIFSAIWLHHYYYVFGFLFIVFIILILTCAEITIVMCYFQLCSEDYRWWWRAYLTAGSSAFYMFLYAGFYFFSKLDITHFISALLFFGVSFIMALVFFTLTGTIGFYACFFFVRQIYASVKVD